MAAAGTLGQNAFGEAHSRRPKARTVRLIDKYTSISTTARSYPPRALGRRAWPHRVTGPVACHRACRLHPSALHRTRCSTAAFRPANAHDHHGKNLHAWALGGWGARGRRHHPDTATIHRDPKFSERKTFATSCGITSFSKRLERR
jgi:hypothetical protein